MRAQGLFSDGDTPSGPEATLPVWRPRRLPVSTPAPDGLSRTVIEVGFGPEEAKLDVIIEGLNAAEQQVAIRAFPGGQRFNVVTRKAS
jgi:hypothetical protein